MIMQIAISFITAAYFCSQNLEPSATTSGQRSQVNLKTLTGDYYLGDGLGLNKILKVSLDGRFSFTWMTDDTLPERNGGIAEVVEGRLVLHPEEPDPHKLITGTTTYNLLPIRWGKRTYLLPETDIEFLRFCNAINLGLEPREDAHGMFYLNVVIDEKALAGEQLPFVDEVEGLPTLPERWEPFVHKGPLHGEIVEVLNDTRARINLGTKHGIQQGMELLVEGGEERNSFRPYGLVKMLATDADTCTAEIKRPKFWQEFNKGQRVSSKIPSVILLKHGGSFFWW